MNGKQDAPSEPEPERLTLAQLNRRARRVFLAERKRGTSQAEALRLAEDAHIGRETLASRARPGRLKTVFRQYG